MSIGYKKLTELIDTEVDEISELSGEQKGVLAELCKKVYMMESSSDYVSAQRLIEEMAGVIGNAADKFKSE